MCHFGLISFHWSHFMHTWTCIEFPFTFAQIQKTFTKLYNKIAVISILMTTFIYRNILISFTIYNYMHLKKFIEWCNCRQKSIIEKSFSQCALLIITYVFSLEKEWRDMLFDKRIRMKCLDVLSFCYLINGLSIIVLLR